MADIAYARPLPTVLQPLDNRARRSRVVSFSSVSETTPSSNPSSGESWFHISASQASSHSSACYCPPLPKGARPASPQPTRIFELDSRSHGTGTDQYPSSIKRSGTFSSSWKLEWRGISKVVKWAVMGDKSNDDASKPGSVSLRTKRGTRDGDFNLHRQEPVSQRLDKPLSRDPYGPGFSPYIYASPTSPLSPSTSATCVDSIYDEYPSHSNFGKITHDSKFPLSEVHLPTQKQPLNEGDLLRRNRSTQTSSCESHTCELKNTNVRRAVSELGHCDPYRPLSTMHDTFYDVNQSTTSLESSCNWPNPHRVAHSDLGHSDGSRAMPPPAFASALSLSYGNYDRYNVKSGTSLRPLSNMQSMRAAISRPVSTSSKGTPLTPHRRPRKLQKSLRSIPTPEKRANQRTMHVSSASPESPSHRSVHSDAHSAAVTAPLVSTKPHPRPPRKLKKKPSPALPPLPVGPFNGDVSDGPPPVPPKYPSFVKNAREMRPVPPSESHSTDVSSGSPALTDTSASTSAEEELNSSQETAATSEDSKFRPPVKRPSLLRTESNRRWTVAVADVPDDLFIEELDRLRRMGLRAGDIHGFHNVMQTSHTLPPSAAARKGSGGGKNTETLEASQLQRNKSSNTVLVQEIGVEDEMEWLHARRAILCCRELVRTERNYQERLQDLANCNVSDAVPALLLQYLPELIGASKLLSTHFNEDLSAYGITNAFLYVAATLESALVPWSGVVGQFFGGNRTPPRTAKPNKGEVVRDTADTEEKSGVSKVRSVSMLGESNLFATRTTSAQFLNGESIMSSSRSHWLFQPAFSQNPAEDVYDKDALSGLRKSFRRSVTKSKEDREKRRRAPFRELAILPTQRATRYVLLFQGNKDSSVVFFSSTMLIQSIYFQSY
ncbi:uncharacterized protein FOMMEDRAFT_27963 [Fomitiporia mediterranea MF3/22]|uniref:uncharacterized protein n=1 Tax=Fomitiporia mediterranea (strain MF3/22) TaxID=694068 RepID=UPI000440935C|nr:uncharacterized protein FOMMEDRAFT_27963 [Fomitiporia mediterranea MF3/22]EJD04202.1 hypothetical protein FOMMEDRAFT_27963 [Fomitiporia mediterranea MF3/22]